jgi:hypothetical protein
VRKQEASMTFAAASETQPRSARRNAGASAVESIIFTVRDDSWGFRKSFSTWRGEETEFKMELAEKALAHAVGNAAAQAYDRSKQIEKRRPLMQDWANHCESFKPAIVTAA